MCLSVNMFLQKAVGYVFFFAIVLYYFKESFYIGFISAYRKGALHTDLNGNISNALQSRFIKRYKRYK